MIDMNQVFVYGTLRSGGAVRGLDSLCEHSELVGPGRTTSGGFSMCDLGVFPAVVPGGNHDVVGEVWRVPDHTMALLDQIEGYPDFYRRQQVSTTHGVAWIYFLPESQGEPVQDINGLLEWRGTK